jgi:hypothetical protein
MKTQLLLFACATSLLVTGAILPRSAQGTSPRGPASVPFKSQPVEVEEVLVETEPVAVEEVVEKVKSAVVKGGPVVVAPEEVVEQAPIVVDQVEVEKSNDVIICLKDNKNGQLISEIEKLRDEKSEIVAELKAKKKKLKKLKKKKKKNDEDDEDFTVDEIESLNRLELALRMAEDNDLKRAFSMLYQSYTPLRETAIMNNKLMMQRLFAPLPIHGVSPYGGVPFNPYASYIPPFAHTRLPASNFGQFQPASFLPASPVGLFPNVMAPRIAPINFNNFAGRAPLSINSSISDIVGPSERFNFNASIEPNSLPVDSLTNRPLFFPAFKRTDLSPDIIDINNL